MTENTTTRIGKDIEKAAALLKRGEVVAIPTETVYGLAGNSLSKDAIRKIYKIKNRPATNPLIMHIANTGEVGKYVKDLPEKASLLAAHFWPGPLTLLLPKTDVVPDMLTAGLPDVAIRIPNHPLTLDLLHRLPFPLAAPSANPYKYISPTNPEHVYEQLKGKIPYILDGGPCSKGIESTIVGFRDGVPVIFRVGSVTPGEIEKIAGKVDIQIKATEKPTGPGMATVHYSPHTPLFIVDSIENLSGSYPEEGTGVLAFQKPHPAIPKKFQEVLSPEGNLEEAAYNLYGALYRLDHLKLKRIIAERVPDTGLGIAINDRLKRAAER